MGAGGSSHWSNPRSREPALEIVRNLRFKHTLDLALGLTRELLATILSAY